MPPEATIRVLLGVFMVDGSSLLQDLITYRDFWRWAVSRFNEAKLFYGHGTDNASDEALQLINSALYLPLQGDEHFLDARLTAEEKQKIVALVERRTTERVPLPYLTGEAWFAGLKFKVNENVLIPRSPIAELVEQGFQPWLQYSPDSILDLCTGSGCIGIACAYAFPDASVDLSDISADAIEIANDNIADHDLDARVRAIQSDLFESIKGNKYDLIVSNPPYVDAADFSSMPEEFNHEPELALASGDDGLDFTRRLLAEARDYLTDEGILIVEVGNSWVALKQAFPELPFIWLEFERGGDGVFMLRRQDLG